MGNGLNYAVSSCSVELYALNEEKLLKAKLTYNIQKSQLYNKLMPNAGAYMRK